MRRLGRILQVHVDSFVASDGRHMGSNIPIHVGGEQLSRLRQELLQVRGVVHIAGTKLPDGAQSAFQIIVNAAKG